MKGKLTLAAALLMGSTALATPALADEAGADAAAGAGINADVNAGTRTQGLEASGSGAADVDTTGSLSGSAGGDTFGRLISAIQADGAGAAEIKAVTDASDVRIVRVDELTGGENRQALDNALESNQDKVAELQSAIEANADLASTLEAQGVSASSVVAAETGADGTVTLYVH